MSHKYANAVAPWPKSADEVTVKAMLANGCARWQLGYVEMMARIREERDQFQKDSALALLASLQAADFGGLAALAFLLRLEPFTDDRCFCVPKRTREDEDHDCFKKVEDRDLALFVWAQLKGGDSLGEWVYQWGMEVGIDMAAIRYTGGKRR